MVVGGSPPPSTMATNEDAAHGKNPYVDGEDAAHGKAM
jgi:hypothetical protein